MRSATDGTRRTDWRHVVQCDGAEHVTGCRGPAHGDSCDPIDRSTRVGGSLRYGRLAGRCVSADPKSRSRRSGRIVSTAACQCRRRDDRRASERRPVTYEPISAIVMFELARPDGDGWSTSSASIMIRRRTRSSPRPAMRRDAAQSRAVTRRAIAERTAGDSHRWRRSSSVQCRCVTTAIGDPLSPVAIRPRDSDLRRLSAFERRSALERRPVRVLRPAGRCRTLPPSRRRAWSPARLPTAAHSQRPSW